MYYNLVKSVITPRCNNPGLGVLQLGEINYSIITPIRCILGVYAIV